MSVGPKVKKVESDKIIQKRNNYGTTATWTYYLFIYERYYNSNKPKNFQIINIKSECAMWTA